MKKEIKSKLLSISPDVKYQTFGTKQFLYQCIALVNIITDLNSNDINIYICK